MGCQKGGELKSIGTQEVPILRTVSVFNLHHPLLVPLRRNEDITTVAD